MAPEQNQMQNMPTSPKELTDLIRSVYWEEATTNGKEFPELAEVKEKLLALPRDESDRDLEKAIAKFADTWAPSVITGPSAPVTQLLPNATNRPQYGTDEEWLAFMAFSVAVNYQRLQKNPIQEEALIRKYKPYFGKHMIGDPNTYEHIYFFHLDVLCRMGQVIEKGNDKDFLEDLLRDARQNSINLTNNLGGAHAFAETTALIFEHASPVLRKYFEEAPENWLEKAANAAEEALKIPYAKFYCTRGRVNALRGKLTEAIFDVNKAKALEDNTRKDYSLRLSQYDSFYQLFRAQQKLEEQRAGFEQTVTEVTAQIEQRENEITQRIEQQEDEMSKRMEAQEKETMAKNMEFLGLFSGIVSFTIGSLTLASNFQAADAMKIAGLIVVLLGALICVFSAFGVILHGFFGTMRDRKTGELKQGFIFRHIAVFILGALIVIGGIVFCIR